MGNAGRILAAASVLVAVALAVVHFSGSPHAGHAHAPLAGMDRSYLSLTGVAPVSASALFRADGSPFPAQGLEGRWTLLFFGFTSCPDVCPTTLQALSAVARDSASGVAKGSTQIVFVSTDPERDTPERLRAYLANFDVRIVGLRGSAEAVRRLADAAGAGFSAGEAQIDHSTSLFVLDPRGRLAGVLLRPSEPARIVADLAKLQRADVPENPRAR